ncbi:MAG: DUF4374 domain-containing protein [Tannerellaceae bacterium]|nr:DUF4374 domain-containing protein [Tannerellaceae bacterium]
MKLKEFFSGKYVTFGLITALFISICSCSDENTGKNGDGEEEVNANNGFFISVMGEESEYIIFVEDVEDGEILMGDDRFTELESSGYTWIFNTDPSAAVGLIYNQGDAGSALGFTVNSAGDLNSPTKFQITSRFTTYGFFDKYAITSVGGQVPLGENQYDENGNQRTDGVTFNLVNLENNFSLTEKSITTLGMVGSKEPYLQQATLSGIVDMEDGTFLTGLVVSGEKDDETTGGSSTGWVYDVDSCWVAVLNSDFEIRKIYRDGGRISYASGRYRSQYYSTIGKADDGTVYVFSSAYDYNNNTAGKDLCGAIKINKGADNFDPDYHFEIGATTNDRRFRKVWHITGNYFLLEFYNHLGGLADYTGPGNVIDAPATTYMIANMSAKTISPISGFPSSDKITATGLPMAYNGKMYFPVTTETDYPIIYVIDPAAAKAEKGLTINGAESVRAVGRLTE